ncbi:hypothetical protein AALP_AA3G354300 [Arabis alpina]|uniref:Uncharacterized protein n=1 Tax=Arabis alpina TaxID=50452 RepID=A0A087HDS6_ARAAL|nr:hypothetical protein AALP_AA3G354300 [Arabis alpina]
MSTKSIILPLFVLLIFISGSQASRQLLWEGFGEMFHKLPGFHVTAGGGDMMNGTHSCSAQGPCSGKQLTCPENCFKTTNVEKEGYKSTSRTGGCSYDCTKCTAACSS